MKKVSKSYWAVVCDGDLVQGDLDGVLITDKKVQANNWCKEMAGQYMEEDFRVARIKLTEVVVKA